MPELPEIEVTRRGLAPHLTGQRIQTAVIRNGALRLPVPENLPRLVSGLAVRQVARRGKYLLLDCGSGYLIFHLGMSGSLRLVPCATPAGKHDHFDLVLENGRCVRLTDPRRFGAVLWTGGDPLRHPLLARLGPEPLSAQFNAASLHAQLHGRSAAIKQVLMDSRVVAGVGNIYANEALFRAGLRPQRAASKVSPARCEKLVAAIRETLRLAIRAGGSSLRNFVGSSGEPGYFQQHYFVYGRGGEPCRKCGTAIRQVRQGQRSSFYCPKCQK